MATKTDGLRDPEVRLKCFLQFRVQPIDAKLFRVASERLGVPMSVFARRVLRREAERVMSAKGDSQ